MSGGGILVFGGHRLKIVRTTILVLVGLLLAFVVFLAGSVIVDALVGGSRVEQLTNTEIAGPDGQMIRAYVCLLYTSPSPRD